MSWERCRHDDALLHPFGGRGEQVTSYDAAMWPEPNTSDDSDMDEVSVGSRRLANAVVATSSGEHVYRSPIRALARRTLADESPARSQRDATVKRCSITGPLPDVSAWFLDILVDDARDDERIGRRRVARLVPPSRSNDNRLPDVSRHFRPLLDEDARRHGRRTDDTR